MMRVFTMRAEVRGPHRRLRLIGLLVGLGAALAVSSLAVRPAAAEETAGAREAQRESPSREQLGALFDAVVKTTDENFVDVQRLQDVEWDRLTRTRRAAVVEAPTLARAVALINELLALLQTSHTALFTPEQVEYYIFLDVFAQQSNLKDLIAARFQGAAVSYEGIGAFTTEIDGRHFIDGILAGSRAAAAGFRFGDEITSVDGASFRPVASFRGKANKEVSVALRRDKDGLIESIPVKVERLHPLQSFRQALQAGLEVHTLRGKRIGYVPVWASRGSDLSKAFAEAVQKTFNPPVDGLIVDLRGKVGGDITTVKAYLEALAPRGPLVSMRSRGDHSPGPVTYRGRSALLIDHHTRSAAEIFAHAFQREFIGPLVGTRTARAVSASRLFAMPGGLLLHLAAYDLELDGVRLEGVGVVPDVEVERPVPYARGSDPVLQRGLEEVARLLEARDAGTRRVNP